VAHRLLVHSYAAEHLVFDLHQVVGIEEIADSEQGICDDVRMRIEGATAFQAILDRFAGSSGIGQISKIPNTCKYNYVRLAASIKLFLRALRSILQKTIRILRRANRGSRASRHNYFGE
jgi:hypothetical protein